MLPQRLREKRAHRVTCTVRTARNRNGGPRGFLKCPVAAYRLGYTRLRDARWSDDRGAGCSVRVPRRTCVDPFLNSRDLFRREFGAIHGHGWFLDPRDQPIDAALIR